MQKVNLLLAAIKGGGQGGESGEDLRAPPACDPGPGDPRPSGRGRAEVAGCALGTPRLRAHNGVTLLQRSLAGPGASPSVS